VIVLDGRDYSKDFIPLRYDPAQVTPERIVAVVREQGFQASIVPSPDKR
jgi:hypothetical protein